MVDEKEGTIFARPDAQGAEAAATLKKPALPSREVWDNPILWREMRTWA